MTTESARKMDMITKSLGASSKEILFDKELHARADQMAQDIDRMAKALGPNFEQNMKGIRDIRFEFSRLGQAIRVSGDGNGFGHFRKTWFDTASLHDWITRLEKSRPIVG